MITSTLKWFKDSSTLPFMVSNDETRKFYKVYHDGGHYVASLPQQRNRLNRKSVRSELDVVFDSAYEEALDLEFKLNEIELYIKNRIINELGEVENIDDYIDTRVSRKIHNFYARKKRFRRKANLNKWNYFVTFTYDDKLLDEKSFEKKLRNCLSHLQCRRGWKYMGKFERAPETGRLHFHGIFYVPNGEMVGKITEKREYSTTSKRMETIFENNFFRNGYGRNDFEDLDEFVLKNGNTVDYIFKYIKKDGQRIIYSRGIPSEIMLELCDSDIVTEMQDFIMKFVLFDDSIDWERDILNYKSKYNQIE